MICRVNDTAWVVRTSAGYYVTPAKAGAFRARLLQTLQGAIFYAEDMRDCPPVPPQLPRRVVIVGGKGVRRRMI